MQRLDHRLLDLSVSVRIGNQILNLFDFIAIKFIETSIQTTVQLDGVCELVHPKERPDRK